jgi:ABC-2 type transport system permease protein
MKLIGVIIKSLKEQIRSYWVLLLSLIMGPFFIFVYYLIVESSKQQYDILIVNCDKGISENGQQTNLGRSLTSFFATFQSDAISAPFITSEITDRNRGIEDLKKKNADAMIIIPASFSKVLKERQGNDSATASEIEFFGDITDANYLISAVWANEVLNEYAYLVTNSKRIIAVKETAVGISGSKSVFDMIVPGLLIVSLIMLMFTASIAFVSEVENKTIIRLKLSGISALEFLGGIGIVQILVGVVSVVLTLLTAILLGFHYEGSLIIMLVIAGLTSLSIIAFSLIIAAVTKSANEVLIVGNFPMFLFMFFTGAAFPLKSEALFTLAGYPVSIQGLMTPVHAISALNKTLVMNMNVWSIMPELIAIIMLTVLYFFIGALIFWRRHLKLA